MKRRIRRTYSIGDVIGHLALISFENKKWTVSCECGSIIKVNSSHLYRKKSCGCLSVSNRFKVISKKDAAFNRKYNHYKQGAKSRNIDFNLSRDEFFILIQKQCYYCGIQPSTACKYRDKEFLVNGVDRYNNADCYRIDNCVPCCSECNRAKGMLGIIDFKIWIKRLYENSIHF